VSEPDYEKCLRATEGRSFEFIQLHAPEITSKLTFLKDSEGRFLLVHVNMRIPAIFKGSVESPGRH